MGEAKATTAEEDGPDALLFDKVLNILFALKKNEKINKMYL